MQGWYSQEEHLKVHNLFYSAVYGEVDDGLVDLGYNVAGEFTIANNGKKNAHCQPAFTLYNGENLLFVDILNSGNIDDSTINRIRDYNRLDRESVEKYLDRTEFSRPEYTNSLDNFDFCFVMGYEQYESHEEGDSNLRDKLNDLKKEGCILTVEPGGELTTQNRGVHGQQLNDRLEEGINVPERTGKYVHLPRDVRQESLAVAICEEIIVGGDLSNGRISILPSRVGRHFGRDLKTDVVTRVLDYLRKINACRIKRQEEAYTFSKFNLDVVLNIRNILSDRPIDDVLDDNKTTGQNATLDEF